MTGPLPARMDAEVSALLAELEALCLARIGKKHSRVVIDNLARLPAQGVPRAAVLQALTTSLDSYRRIDPVGAPFSLSMCKAIADAGCLQLPWLVRRLERGAPLFGLEDVEALGVAQHADALLPAFGDEDAELCARAAWKNLHTFRQHLVVGQGFERNDGTPVRALFDAWQAQGAPGRAGPAAAAPVGVVLHDDAPALAGVIYAVGDEQWPSDDVRERFVPRWFLLSPHQGDNVPLDVDGVARLLAALAPPIAPASAAWIVTLCAMTDPAAPVRVPASTMAALRDLERTGATPLPAAASALLGIGATPPAPSADELEVHVGARRLRYRAGELSVSELLDTGSE